MDDNYSIKNNSHGFKKDNIIKKDNKPLVTCLYILQISKQYNIPINKISDEILFDNFTK